MALPNLMFFSCASKVHQMNTRKPNAMLKMELYPCGLMLLLPIYAENNPAKTAKEIIIIMISLFLFLFINIFLHLLNRVLSIMCHRI